MTFIQPNKKQSFFNIILVILAVVVGIGTFAMVALYNTTVNLEHNIATAKAELDAVGAQSIGLNNKIVATLGGNGLSQLAAQDGLVTESKPQYFSIEPTDQPINQKWPIASHY